MFLKINVDKGKIFDCIVNIVLIIYILVGIGTSIYMLTVNRSLWLDEAAFAYSFSQRNLINLTEGAFEWDQTAPIIYMYIVKIITIALGNSAITLRLFSFLSYMLILVLSYFISKKVFKFKYPLFTVAYISSMSFILKYSNMFKPYIFDGVICLFIIFMYYLYNEKKINFRTLIIIYMVAIWASNPACFFIGAILLCEFIVALKQKDYKKVRNVIIGGLGVLLSFVIYYFYWLKQTATSGGMQTYWEDNNFPLIPKNQEEWDKFNRLYLELAGRFDNNWVLTISLSIISLAIGIYKKDKYKITIIIAVLLAFFASSINMFPVVDRLWIFIYPILTILAFETINTMISTDNIKKVAIVGLAFALIFPNTGIQKYTNKGLIYMGRNEEKALIDYLYNNIETDEKIYLHYYAIPAFMYYNGYNSKTFQDKGNEIICAYSKENTYRMFLDNIVQIDSNDIIKNDKVYIILNNWNQETKQQLSEVKEYGYIELVLNYCDTPLYYYTNDTKNLKSKVEYKIKETKYEDGVYKLILTIKNIGKTIINNEFESVALSSKQDESIKKKLGEELQKNKEKDIELELNFDKIKEYELQLVSEGNYWYDEIGIEPIKINKNMFK